MALSTAAAFRKARNAMSSFLGVSIYTSPKRLSNISGHRLNKQYPQLKRNLFIVTYGRSGSTLLQRLVQTIPGCTLRGENFNVIRGIWQSAVSVHNTRNLWGNSRQPELSPWHGADRVRPDIYAEALIDAMIAHVLRPPQDARYFGFKEIRYVQLDDRFPELLHFMRAHFKDAFFIFNTRDAEDVKKSAWWKNKDPDHIRQMVAKMDQRFADYHAANPDHSELLSYESFSKNSSALRPLFEKLGEPLNETQVHQILSERLRH